MSLPCGSRLFTLALLPHPSFGLLTMPSSPHLEALTYLFFFPHSFATFLFPCALRSMAQCLLTCSPCYAVPATTFSLFPFPFDL